MKPKRIEPLAGQPFEMIEGARRNSTLYISQGYAFRCRTARNKMRYLACYLKKCNVRANADLDKKILYPTNLHQHKADPTFLLKVKVMSAVKKQAEQTNLKFREIHENTLRRFNITNPLELGLDFKSLEGSMTKRRHVINKSLHVKTSASLDLLDSQDDEDDAELHEQTPLMFCDTAFEDLEEQSSNIDESVYSEQQSLPSTSTSDCLKFNYFDYNIPTTSKHVKSSASDSHEFDSFNTPRTAKTRKSKPEPVKDQKVASDKQNVTECDKNPRKDNLLKGGRRQSDVSDEKLTEFDTQISFIAYKRSNGNSVQCENKVGTSSTEQDNSSRFIGHSPQQTDFAETVLSVEDTGVDADSRDGINISSLDMAEAQNEESSSKCVETGIDKVITNSSNSKDKYLIHRQDHLNLVLAQLAEDETFMDVTLTAEGTPVKAHKSVLSAVSPYFSSVLKANPCQHPIIIMPSEVKHKHLTEIISFVYKGDANVSVDELKDFLKAAEMLNITSLYSTNCNYDTPTGFKEETKETNVYKQVIRGPDISKNHVENSGKTIKEIKPSILTNQSPISTPQHHNEECFDSFKRPTDLELNTFPPSKRRKISTNNESPSRNNNPMLPSTSTAKDYNSQTYSKTRQKTHSISYTDYFDSASSDEETYHRQPTTKNSPSDDGFDSFDFVQVKEEDPFEDDTGIPKDDSELQDYIWKLLKIPVK